MKTRVIKKKKIQAATPVKTKSASQNFGLFFLNAIYGPVFFKSYLIHYYSTVTPDAHTYFQLYVRGWLLAVGAALFFGLLWKLVRETLFPKESCFYSTLILFNLAYAFYIYLPDQMGKDNSLTTFLVLQLVWGAVARLFDIGGRTVLKTNILYGLMMVLGLAWLTRIYPGWYSIGDWQVYNYLFFLLIGGFLLFGVKPIPEELPHWFQWDRLGTNRYRRIGSYFLAFLLIGFSINTLFNYDPHHYSFYLGPVADLAGGKSLLVNINCQYGVLVIYFLRFCFLFLPLGLVSFSLVLAVLTGIQYMLFFFVVRQLFRSETLSFFSLVVLLMINQLAQDNGLGILFPSVGPLRFGFIYVMMTLIILRNRYPAKRGLLLWLESFLAGVAFFWSMEVCVYVVVPYLGFLLYESLDLRDKFRLDLGGLLKRSSMLACCILAIGGLFYLDVFRRTHEWPHWAYYFDLLNTYGNGFGMLSLPVMDYWWLVLCIFYFSLFAIAGIVLQKRKALPEDLNVMVILLFCGALQFTYYLRRAHTMNLYHLSMPAILLALYWLYFVLRYDPPSMPAILKKMGYGVAALLAAFFLQKTAGFDLVKIKMQPLSPLVMVHRILDLPNQFHNSADTDVLHIAQLMDKYSGKEARSLVYFLGDDGLYVSMYSGRTNVYPYNDIVQPTISPKAMDRIMDFDPHLKMGDYIYCGFMPQGDFEGKLFEKIDSRFGLQLVERTGGVSVYRVSGEKAPS